MAEFIVVERICRFGKMDHTEQIIKGKCFAGRECYDPIHCEGVNNHTHDHPRIFTDIKCSHGIECDIFNHDPTKCSFAHGTLSLISHDNILVDKNVVRKFLEILCPLDKDCSATKYCPYWHSRYEEDQIDKSNK